MSGASVAGRPVVVTGAGNGIGAALALEAARRGAGTVMVADIDADAADRVAAEVRAAGPSAVTACCDVTDSDALERLAHELIGAHGIPALVCANAGVAAAGNPILEGSMTDARWVMEVNFFGVLATMAAFGRRIAAASQPGWLLVTGSEHSLGLPHAGAGAYTASKHGVLGLCETLRAELPAHMGVSVLCPGLTSSRLWASGTQRPDAFGGPREPHDIAKAIIERGMPAHTVAERAFDGVAEGQFVIPTHYNARAYADARASEVGAAFEALSTIDTSSWDVSEAAASVLADLAAQADAALSRPDDPTDT